MARRHPAPGVALPDAFFERDAAQLAAALLGKVIRRRIGDLWLAARIIETEAYYLNEKGSHASLGYTHKRRALFMDGGVIYMYYARGGDSLNFSAAGPGNAVLINTPYSGSEPTDKGNNCSVEDKSTEKLKSLLV